MKGEIKSSNPQKSEKNTELKKIVYSNWKEIWIQAIDIFFCLTFLIYFNLFIYLTFLYVFFFLAVSDGKKVDIEKLKRKKLKKEKEKMKARKHLQRKWTNAK